MRLNRSKLQSPPQTAAIGQLVHLRDDALDTFSQSVNARGDERLTRTDLRPRTDAHLIPTGCARVHHRLAAEEGEKHISEVQLRNSASETHVECLAVLLDPVPKVGRLLVQPRRC